MKHVFLWLPCKLPSVDKLQNGQALHSGHLSVSKSCKSNKMHLYLWCHTQSSPGVFSNSAGEGLPCHVSVTNHTVTRKSQNTSRKSQSPRSEKLSRKFSEWKTQLRHHLVIPCVGVNLKDLIPRCAKDICPLLLVASSFAIVTVTESTEVSLSG